MAHIHPGREELENLPTPLNVGERRVLDCLAKLDDEWAIYVQPRLGLDQPDFVTVHRDYGVCVIEVKDWASGLYRQDRSGVVYYATADTWIATDERPRHQANRYRTAIHSLLGDLVNDVPPIKVIRGIVVMPRLTQRDAQALFATGRVDNNDDYVKVFGFDSADSEPLLMLTGQRQPMKRPFVDGLIDALTRCLTEPEATSDQRAPLSLSQAAANIANNPSNAKIRRVRGAAGCGKSLGLAARAARLAGEGKEVLVVSFNSTLPHYLRDLAARRCREIGAPLAQITFTHLHALCKRATDDARLAGAELSTGMLPGTIPFFEELIELGIAAYRGGFGPRFDAVLVDEGQDFSLNWWNFLRHFVCRPDGELLLVADPAQDIYGKRAWTDEERMRGAGFSGPWAELGGSYRLPPDYTPVVADFAQLVLGNWDKNLSVPLDHPQNIRVFEPTVRRWVNSKQIGNAGLVLGHEVIALLRSNPDLAPSDVVFLANSHEEGLQAAGVITSAGFDVRHVFGRTPTERHTGKLRFWGSATGVKGCTYQSFKGWESRAVVMSVGYGEQRHRNAYVGLTRVKGDRTNRRAFVTVVNTDRKLDTFRNRFEQAS